MSAAGPVMSTKQVCCSNFILNLTTGLNALYSRPGVAIEPGWPAHKLGRQTHLILLCFCIHRITNMCLSYCVTDNYANNTRFEFNIKM